MTLCTTPELAWSHAATDELPLDAAIVFSF
jgi:hypothetical protein